MRQFTEAEMNLGNAALVLSGLVEAKVPWTGTTYWTCFGYDGVVPDKLHCTHKYFGEQPEGFVENVVAICDAYFQEPRSTPTIVFKREDWFGPDKAARVLRPADDGADWFFLDLRERLNPFANDNYPELKPHVTTTLDAVAMPFTRYCLCQGKTIIAEWPINESR